MNKKNIIYIASIINNRGGGASKSPVNLIKSFYRLKSKIILLSNSPFSDIPLNKNTNLKFRRLKYSLYGKSIDIRRDNFFMKILKIAKYLFSNIFIESTKIDCNEYEILLVDSLHSHFAKEKNKINHKNSYLIFRISPDYYFNYNKITDKESLLKIFNGYKKIIFPSKFVKNEWSNIYPDIKTKFEYLYNYIDEENIENINNNDKFVIGCVGNFVYSKGQDIALNAFIQLAETHPKVEFYFAGKPLEKFGYETIKRIKEINKKYQNIKYVGYTKNIFKYLSRTDILVVPSRTDMFPRVVLEGLYSKTIVIGSSVGGMNDMIIDNYNGFLFEHHDEEGLIKIIRKIFKMTIDERDLIKENAYDHYQKVFSQKNQVKRLKEIL